MRYRKLGGTGLDLSEIAFGCGGNAGLMVRGTAAEQEHAVGRALDLGINYFDNSPDYGDGRAEEALGRALKSLRQRPLVNSKVEIRAADLADIAGHVERSVEASLIRLGLDHLDVLQIHNGPSTQPVRLEGKVYARLSVDDYERPGGALEGVRRILTKGKARVAGFICRGDDGADVRRILSAGNMYLINVPYTLLNPTAGRIKPAGLQVDRDYGQVIGAAAAAGGGAAIYSPLAGGFLTEETIAQRARHPLARPARGSEAEVEGQRAKAAAFAFLTEATGLTLAQAAIRFILMNDDVTTVLGGFSSETQLEETVRAAAAPAFTADILTRIEAAWAADLAG